MENDSGERDRYEQLCIFHFLAAIDVLSAEPRADVLIHMSLDSYGITFSIGVRVHAHRVACPQACVDKIVSVPRG
jgi:hypothetical protein